MDFISVKSSKETVMPLKYFAEYKILHNDIITHFYNKTMIFINPLPSINRKL